MSKRTAKKSNRIVRDMEECFRSFHLPVDKNKLIQGNPMNVAFISQLCNDRVCAAILVTHDKQLGYAGIKIAFHLKVPSERLTDVLQLLNLCNENMSFNHFVVCPCCNEVSLKAALFLPDDSLPRGKFKRLIQNMLEDSYLCSSLIEEVATNGNPEVFYDRFMDDHKDDMKKEGALSTEVESKILSDMESVLTVLKITIEGDDRRADGFVMNFLLEGMDIPLQMKIRLSHSNEAVIMYLTPPCIVPNEKLPVVTELINWLNRGSVPDHFFIHRETKHLILLKGIMIDSGVLDKREFEMAVHMLLINGRLFFPIINEQLSSNETPEVLLEKIKENYKNSH
jgi:hypothetical protein